MAGLQSLYARAELEPVAGNPYVTNGIKYLRIYNLTPAEFDVTVVKADGSQEAQVVQAANQTPGLLFDWHSGAWDDATLFPNVEPGWTCSVRVRGGEQLVGEYLTTDDLRQMLFIQRR